MKRFRIQWGSKKLRFACDVHLAKIAKYLRLMGFDAWYRNDITDDELVGMARFGRIALTCDRRLQERLPQSVVLLSCEDAQKQIRRIAKMFDLARYAHPMKRSLCCNRPLLPVSKVKVRKKIPKETYRWLDGFWICPKCKKVYWQGTHAKRMRENIVEWLGLSENV
ncbi:Mut7-C RNAse domain-containing protein [Hydrogenimonas sp.]